MLKHQNGRVLTLDNIVQWLELHAWIIEVHEVVRFARPCRFCQNPLPLATVQFHRNGIGRLKYNHHVNIEMLGLTMLHVI